MNNDKPRANFSITLADVEARLQQVPKNMIRVLIERYVQESRIQDYQDLLHRARNKASNVAGYLSGEIHQDRDDVTHIMLLSTWDNIESWETWANSEHRMELLDDIRPLLLEDERVVVLEPVPLNA